MKRSSGFTIVELAVVIVVLAILVTVTVVTFGRTQSDARNTSSKAKSVAIAEGLERYYETNGEYPSCALVTQANTATVTSTVLKGLDPNTLTRAGAASGTNSIDCNAPGTTNFAYSSNSTGYTLSYREERTGQIVTFTSRH